MAFSSKYSVHNSSSEKARLYTRIGVTSFFLLVFIHFAAQVNFNNQHRPNEKQGIRAQHQQSKAIYQPVHSPSQSDTGLPNAEFLRETEVQEKPFPCTDYSIQASLFLTSFDSFVITKKLQQHFLRSLQNRPALSLIILHHSWKSFLS